MDYTNLTQKGDSSPIIDRFRVTEYHEVSMHWADIAAAIQKANSSMTKIAISEDVSIQTVSAVIKGDKTSHRIAYAISAVTGIPTERMWPGKYLTPAAYEKARGRNTCGRLPETKEVVNG